MNGHKRRVKTFERRLDIGRGPTLFHVPPSPPIINPDCAWLNEKYPRRAGETDQEYLDRLNDPGPQGWIYEDYIDCGGGVKIAFPARSKPQGV